MKPITVMCPHCGRKARGPKSLIGKTVRCGGCKKPFPVTASKEPPPTPRRTAAPASAPGRAPKAPKAPKAKTSSRRTSLVGRLESEAAAQASRERRAASFSLVRGVALAGIAGGVIGVLFVGYSMFLAFQEQSLSQTVSFSVFFAAFLELWNKVLLIVAGAAVLRGHFDGRRLFRFAAAYGGVLLLANICFHVFDGMPRFPTEEFDSRPLRQLAVEMVYGRPAPAMIKQVDDAGQAQWISTPSETGSVWAYVFAVLAIVAFHITVNVLLSRRSSELALEAREYADSRGGPDD